jgi:tetratricopeptide (TPR) repeat protein
MKISLCLFVVFVCGTAYGQTPDATAAVANELYKDGVQSYTRGLYSEAEYSFRKLYNMTPDDERGMVGLVETYTAQKRIDKALEILQAAIQKNPDRNGYRIALGNIFVRSEQYDRALEQYRIVLEQTTDREARGGLLLKIGETYRLKGDLSEAIAYFREAIVATPKNPTPMVTLALVLQGMGKFEEAKPVYLEILKLNPNEPLTLNNLAFFLASGSEADVDMALEYALRARKVSPDDIHIADTLGWVYLKKHRVDEAIAIFQENLNHEMNNTNFQDHLKAALKEKEEAAAKQ